MNSAYRLITVGDATIEPVIPRAAVRALLLFFCGLDAMGRLKRDAH
jgi:hypothetical protein